MKLEAVRSLVLVGAVVLLASCHKQVAVVRPPAAPPSAVAKASPLPPAQSVPVRPPETTTPVTAAVPDAATTVRIQELLDRIQDVYFDYDKHNLRQDAQATLEADAKDLREILQHYPAYKLTVEGFCDERGSDEYNLALGDSRAKKAEQFLEQLGLPASQLRTVSFGKEKPVCTEPTESCWQKNRRAHITQDQTAG